MNALCVYDRAILVDELYAQKKLEVKKRSENA